MFAVSCVLPGSWGRWRSVHGSGSDALEIDNRTSGWFDRPCSPCRSVGTVALGRCEKARRSSMMGSLQIHRALAALALHTSHQTVYPVRLSSWDMRMCIITYTTGIWPVVVVTAFLNNCFHGFGTFNA